MLIGPLEQTPVKCWSQLMHFIQENIFENVALQIQENIFENVTWKMAIILAGPQCAKLHDYWVHKQLCGGPLTHA